MLIGDTAFTGAPCPVSAPTLTLTLRIDPRSVCSALVVSALLLVGVLLLPGWMMHPPPHRVRVLPLVGRAHLLPPPPPYEWMGVYS